MRGGRMAWFVRGLKCWVCLCEGDVVPVLRVSGDELKLTAAYVFRVIYPRSHPKPPEATRKPLRVSK